MGKVIIQQYTTKYPITMIGEEAGTCWGADTSDSSKNYKRGLECLSNEHGRTTEYPDVYMIWMDTPQELSVSGTHILAALQRGFRQAHGISIMSMVLTLSYLQQFRITHRLSMSTLESWQISLTG